MSQDFTPEEIMADAEAGLKAAGFKPVETGLEDKYLAEAWSEFVGEHQAEMSAKINSGNFTLADFQNYLQEALTAGYMHGYANGCDAPEVVADLLKAIRDAHNDPDNEPD